MRFGALIVVAGVVGWVTAEAAETARRTIGHNFDTGLGVAEAKRLLVDETPLRPPVGSVVRLRGIESWGPAGGGVVPPPDERARRVAERREQLAALRAAGYRPVVFVRWDTESWRGGVRPGSRQCRLPLDLREAFARTEELGRTYGDLVDWWEIDNEPDVSFVQENPETYAAFLKACYLGFAAGASAGGAPAGRSQVLMGPLALPPGPFFEAFVRNDGLRYTDGFNYHFYGYAEDFTGMYRQFEAAVAELAGPGRGRAAPGRGRDGATWQTRVMPLTAGWRPRFDHLWTFLPEVTAARRAERLAAPSAAEEPRLHGQGRWLVSGGVTVEESDHTVRFRIERWPEGPLRMPLAELVLPPGTRLDPHGVLGFYFRLVDPSEAEAARLQVATAVEVLSKGERSRRGAATTPVPEPGGRAQTASPGVLAGGSATAGGHVRRGLPIFLTEYGYSLLDAASRRTAEGRARQQAFFRSALQQIEALGIEGAMAFLLSSYLERDLIEYGLRMDETAAPPEVWSAGAASAAARWGGQAVSPALADLLTAGERPLQPRRWTVETPPAGPVVIDFAARRGLGDAKMYSGYFMEASVGPSGEAEGDLIVYNFGREAKSGYLVLEGEAWAHAAPAERRRALRLGPGERRLVPVRIQPKVRRFEPSDLAATFEPGPVPEPAVAADGANSVPATSGSTATVVGAATAAAATVPAAAATPSPPPPRSGTLNMLSVYLRTENGNLYQVWPRQLLTPEWTLYQQQLANFSSSFYNRHALPWRFTDNTPQSFVVFFHPEKLPLTVELQMPYVASFAAP